MLSFIMFEKAPVVPIARPSQQLQPSSSAVVSTAAAVNAVAAPSAAGIKPNGIALGSNPSAPAAGPARPSVTEMGSPSPSPAMLAFASKLARLSPSDAVAEEEMSAEDQALIERINKAREAGSPREGGYDYDAEPYQGMSKVVKSPRNVNPRKPCAIGEIHRVRVEMAFKDTCKIQADEIEKVLTFLKDVKDPMFGQLLDMIESTLARAAQFYPDRILGFHDGVNDFRITATDKNGKMTYFSLVI